MVVLAVFAVVIPFTSTIKKSEVRQDPLLLRTEDELSLLSGDSDRNGTEDWKDLVLSTMSSSTKELVKGAPVDEKTLARLNDPNNLTASFSKNVYTASAFVSQNKTSAAEQERMIASLAIAEGSKITTKKYTIKDVSLYKQDTAVEKKAYGNSLGRVVQKINKNKLGQDYINRLNEYAENKDVATLDFFAEKADGLRVVLNDLLKMSVPSSASVFHINLVNSTSQLIATLDAFSKTDEDPLKSLAFVNSYAETLYGVLNSVAILQDYFNLEGVSFTSKDDGYVFIK